MQSDCGFIIPILQVIFEDLDLGTFGALGELDYALVTGNQLFL